MYKTYRSWRSDGPLFSPESALFPIPNRYFISTYTSIISSTTDCPSRSFLHTFLCRKITHFNALVRIFLQCLSRFGSLYIINRTTTQLFFKNVKLILCSKKKKNFTNLQCLLNEKYFSVFFNDSIRNCNIFRKIPSL